MQNSWVSSDDDDDFGAGFGRQNVRAPTVFDLSAKSDEDDDYDAEYLERTSGALALDLAHIDSLLYAPTDDEADAETALADVHAVEETSDRRPNIDRNTGLIIPHGTTPATERLAECRRWRRAFPHLRAVGTRITPPDGWVSIAEVDPRAMQTMPKQPSAAGVDAHYALDEMLSSEAVEARDLLSVVGTALVPAQPEPAQPAPDAVGTGTDEDDTYDPPGELLIASHGSLEEVFAVDVETEDDRRWAAVRPDLSHAARELRQMKRWGLPPVSPALDNERLDAATRAVWRAMIAELEPHIAALAQALTGKAMAQKQNSSEVTQQHTPHVPPQPVEPSPSAPGQQSHGPAATPHAPRESSAPCENALAMETEQLKPPLEQQQPQHQRQHQLPHGRREGGSAPHPVGPAVTAAATAHSTHPSCAAPSQAARRSSGATPPIASVSSLHLGLCPTGKGEAATAAAAHVGSALPGAKLKRKADPPAGAAASGLALGITPAASLRHPHRPAAGTSSADARARTGCCASVAGTSVGFVGNAFMPRGTARGAARARAPAARAGSDRGRLGFAPGHAPRPLSPGQPPLQARGLGSAGAQAAAVTPPTGGPLRASTCSRGADAPAGSAGGLPRAGTSCSAGSGGAVPRQHHRRSSADR